MVPTPTRRGVSVAATFPDAPGWQVQKAVPFSSARKWSGATFPGRGTWVMGAPEVVAPHDGEVEEIAAAASALGQRVLLVAYSDNPLTGDTLPAGLEPVVVMALGDPVRADAADTLRYFAEQGVELKVISGDHPHTASAIAARAGVPRANAVMDARDLPADPESLAEALEQHAVFGRVDPHQKRSMVGALQSRRHVVAMTGDGVNDVLALKDADIGVAMGISGVVFAVVASLTFYGGRSFAAMTNYVDMDSKSRNALDHMSREIRQADSVINYSTATLTSGPFAGKVVTNQIVLPGKEINASNQTNNYTLTYTYDPVKKELYRVQGVGQTAQKTVLLEGCDYLSFGMFQRNTGNTEDDLFDALPVSVLGTCKLVQIDWVCSRSLLGNRANTESVQSAQVVIRKK